MYIEYCLWAQVALLVIYWTVWDRYMQVLYLGRAPRTKETLPDFLKWRRVTRHPLVFRGLTGSQQTPGFGASQFPLSFPRFTTRCVVSLKAKAIVINNLSRVVANEEELVPWIGHSCLSFLSLARSGSSRQSRSWIRTMFYLLHNC